MTFNSVRKWRLIFAQWHLIFALSEFASTLTICPHSLKNIDPGRTWTACSHKACDRRGLVVVNNPDEVLQRAGFDGGVVDPQAYQPANESSAKTSTYFKFGLTSCKPPQCALRSEVQ
ncbi:hypothetical protein DFH06DRAFT_1222969 [Mycena polygramma]|nr:hypothetical protein DFH06DRAFT_1222969 [Mycena polygramma]